MDEVYIVTVRGERLYLWRAIDQDGDDWFKNERIRAQQCDSSKN
jgi:transposase-like protein